MSITHLHFRDLRYLCAVAEHKHFGRAANACAVSQPALSERIRHIEATLDTTVFERSKRQVLVTDRGQQLITQAQKLLDTAAEADEICNKSAEPLSGPLKLGVIATLGPYLIPYLLRPLKKQYPNLALQLSEGLTEDLLDQLASGQLDMIIAALPIERTGFRHHALFFEPFYLAAPKTHPICDRDFITSKQLDGEEMILLQEGHCLSGQALNVCPAKKQLASNRLQATGIETLRQMIACGEHYTLLPYLSVGKNPPLKALIDYRPLDGAGRSIALVYRNSYRNQNKLAALKKLIVSNIPDELTAQ